MRMVSILIDPPLQYPDITMTNTYGKPADESEEMTGVLTSRVGIGKPDKLSLCISLLLNFHSPHGIL